MNLNKWGPPVKRRQITKIREAWPAICEAARARSPFLADDLRGYEVARCVNGVLYLENTNDYLTAGKLAEQAMYLFELIERVAGVRLKKLCHGEKGHFPSIEHYRWLERDRARRRSSGRSPRLPLFPHPDCCPKCRGVRMFRAIMDTPAKGGYRAAYACDKGHTWTTFWAKYWRVGAEDLAEATTQ